MNQEQGTPSEAGQVRDPAKVAESDAWVDLRRYTAARIALGRSGASLPLREQLAFGLAHAQARDAVHIPLDSATLRRQFESEGWQVTEVHSQAPDRNAYLARPDWGRRLHPASVQVLSAAKRPAADLVFVVSDGLSSAAVQNHAVPLLREVRERLPELAAAPVVIAVQARVALADEVGQLVGAAVAVSVIGERPGLSSPDSLGVYLTWGPRVGRSDAERNCISNIRPQGLGYTNAAAQLSALISAAQSAGLSGVRLRFDASALPDPGVRPEVQLEPR